jgi:hypothetical protein
MGLAIARFPQLRARRCGMQRQIQQLEADLLRLNDECAEYHAAMAKEIARYVASNAALHDDNAVRYPV